jgi:uncharacterized membrane protein YoaK (UPF0700 family)
MSDVRGLPLILGLIAGSTDTISFLGMKGLFTAHITGDLVVLATRLVTGDSATLAFMLALPVFILSLLLTSLLANRLRRSGIATLVPLLSLELLLLLVCLALCITCHPRFDDGSAVGLTVGMFGVAAMAVQSALVQLSLSNTPSTAVMTTNMTSLVVALAEVWTRHEVTAVEKARRRIGQVLPVIVGFTLGCALGAVVEAVSDLWSLGLPAVMTLLALAVACRQSIAS